MEIGILLRLAVGGGGRLACMMMAAAAAAGDSIVAQSSTEPSPRYALRADGRREVVDAKTAAAIAAGLDWLALHQSADGRWDADAFMKHDAEDRGPPCDGKGPATRDIGVTALACLAFLADGHHPEREGGYGRVVRRGCDWLVSQQGADGCIREGNDAYVYGHCVATQAIVEAAGLSGLRGYRKIAAKALEYLERHRNPKLVWRYHPRDDDNDTSATAWAMQAVVAGRDFGFASNPALTACVRTWVDGMTDPSTGRTGYIDRGGFSARLPGDHASRYPRENGEDMTAASLYLRVLLGDRPWRDAITGWQAALVGARLPRWADGHVNLYYWYYGTLALHEIGGKEWSNWWKALTRALVGKQRGDGNFAGSWDPVSVWSVEGGRVYSTAMSVLCLTAPYRFAPVASTSPIPEGVDGLGALAAAWRKREFGRVASLLDRFERGERDDAVADAIERTRAAFDVEVELARQALERLRTVDDPLLRFVGYEELARSYRGHAIGEAADAAVRATKRDRAAKKEVDASRALRAITLRYRGAEKPRAQRKELAALVKKFAGTKAAARASTWLEVLQRY